MTERRVTDCKTCVFSNMSKEEADDLIDQIITKSLERLGFNQEDAVTMRSLFDGWRDAKKTVSSSLFDVMKSIWSLVKKLAAVAFILYMCSKLGFDLSKVGGEHTLMKLGE